MGLEIFYLLGNVLFTSILKNEIKIPQDPNKIYTLIGILFEAVGEVEKAKSNYSQSGHKSSKLNLTLLNNGKSSSETINFAFKLLLGHDTSLPNDEKEIYGLIGILSQIVGNIPQAQTNYEKSYQSFKDLLQLGQVAIPQPPTIEQQIPQTLAIELVQTQPPAVEDLETQITEGSDNLTQSQIPERSPPEDPQSPFDAAAETPICDRSEDESEETDDYGAEAELEYSRSSEQPAIEQTIVLSDLQQRSIARENFERAGMQPPERDNFVVEAVFESHLRNPALFNYFSRNNVSQISTQVTNNPTERLIFAKIEKFHHSKKMSALGVNLYSIDIANDLKMHPKTIRTHLKALEEKGLIWTKKANARKTSAIIIFLGPNPNLLSKDSTPSSSLPRVS